jgi:DNA gyrase/topoisomerase IV subunit A
LKKPLPAERCAGHPSGVMSRKDEPMTEANTEKDIRINFWRQHIIEGLLKARHDAGKVIEVLNTEENAKEHLIEQLQFTDYQAQSILDLNRPIGEIDEELLIAEQKRLKAEETELKARRNQEDTPDQEPVR